MDIKTIWGLVTAHNWLALAIVAIGWGVQLLSPESKFPFTIPPSWFGGRNPKPFVAALLGLVYGILVVHQVGVPWLTAIKEGLLTGLGTAGLFDVIVNFVFNGKAPAWLLAFALVLPKKNPPATDQKPPTIPPAAGGVAAAILVASIGWGSLMLGAQANRHATGGRVDTIRVESVVGSNTTAALTGCAWLKSSQGQQVTGLAEGDMLCILPKLGEPALQIVQECNIDQQLLRQVEGFLSAHKKFAQLHKTACFNADTLATDAGAPDAK